MSTLKTNRIENLTTTDGGISIDNSGNVGVGTTSPSSLLTLGGADTTGSSQKITYKAGSADAASIEFVTEEGGVNRDVGIKLNVMQNTTAFTLLYAEGTNGGRVGIGTTSPQSTLDVRGASSTLDSTRFNLQVIDTSSIAAGVGGGINFGYEYNSSGDVINRAASIGVKKENATDGNYASALTFHTAANSSSTAERMRIDSSGNITLYAGTPDWVIRPGGISDIYGRVDIGKDASAVSGTGLYVVSSDDNSYGAAVNFRNTGTGPSIISRTSAGADAFRVENNGDVKSATNSYGAVSDVKMKENIVDASSQWDDVKAIRVRKFNFKEDTLYDTSTQIGVIAQEIEAVSPGLVTSMVDSDEEGNDLGTVTKSVKYSVLYMKSVKALQEAMSRIETLEAEVAALKSN
jgi:hypothetical protein